MRLLERHPEPGFSFPIADLPLPVFYNEIVQLTELPGAVEERADISHPGRRHVQCLQEMATQFYGDRSGGVRDPSGVTWWISMHVEDVSREEMARRMAEARK